VKPVSAAFLQGLRALCDEIDALLIFDEVQVGLGRTGSLWAHEKLGVAPDLLTIAKPLAGGLPMGAVLLTERVAQAIRPGDHATTFGGGPLVAAAALAVCRKIGNPEFLAEVQRKAQIVARRLQPLAHERDEVTEVRGAGLLWGVETAGSAAEVVSRALAAGLLLCTAGANVVRVAPPLNISDEDLERGLQMLIDAL
jgi:acetylornithine/succinyldiaminopimelate/putrescine aminotransferase